MRLEFPPDEFEERLGRAQELIRGAGLNGLVLTAEANLNWFTGWRHFCPWTTFTRPAILAVPREGTPSLLVQGFLVADAVRDCWFDDVRGYESLTGVPTGDVVAMLANHGMTRGPLGAELGAEQRLGMSLVEWERIVEALPEAQLADAADMLWALRLIKSPLEIAATRRSGQISAAAFAAMWTETGAGSTELEAATTLARVIASEGGEVGFRIVTSGSGDYDRTSGQARNRRLVRGDMLWVDLGVIYNGYWTDHCRAAVVGGPTDEQRHNWEALLAVTRCGVDAVGPGVPVRDVVRACEAEVQRQGMTFSFAAGRMGHGMGLMSTEPPHVAAYDGTVLREGMIVTVEPGWVERHGTYVAEENLAVTATGAELLTVTPRPLGTL